MLSIIKYEDDFLSLLHMNDRISFFRGTPSPWMWTRLHLHYHLWRYIATRYQLQLYVWAKRTNVYPPPVQYLRTLLSKNTPTHTNVQSYRRRLEAPILCTQHLWDVAVLFFSRSVYLLSHTVFYIHIWEKVHHLCTFISKEVPVCDAGFIWA